MTQLTPADVDAIFERSDCLYTQQAVDQAVDTMAETMTGVLKDKNPVVISVMVGGITPAAMLLMRLNFPLQVDYLHATRYNGEITGSTLEWLVPPRTALKDRVVVIVDDILDGGLTLSGILDYCREQGAAKVYSAVLVDKETTRETGGLDVADFTAITVPNRYVFGCGMDYKGYLRNAPGIYAAADVDS